MEIRTRIDDIRFLLSGTVRRPWGFVPSTQGRTGGRYMMRTAWGRGNFTPRTGSRKDYPTLKFCQVFVPSIKDKDGDWVCS